MLHCTGEPVGVTRTRKPLSNFELVAQWRHLQSGGNSGIFVWASESSLEGLKPGNLPRGGIEVQILDHGYRDQYEKQTGKKADWFTTDGDVFPVGTSKMTPFPPVSPDGSRSFPSRRLSKGVGQWNHYYCAASTAKFACGSMVRRSLGEPAASPAPVTCAWNPRARQLNSGNCGSASCPDARHRFRGRFPSRTLGASETYTLPPWRAKARIGSSPVPPPTHPGPESCELTPGVDLPCAATHERQSENPPMSTDKPHTAAVSVTLDEHERSELSALLEVALRDLRVEIHRTHTPDYRDKLVEREALLQRLIAKFPQGSK